MKKKGYKARTARAWETKIKKSMKDAGVYQKSFDSAISLAASVLEQRDATLQQYYDEYNGAPLVQYTNSAGATNLAKNPALMLSVTLTDQATRLLNQLGLTARGLKAIRAEMASDANGALADLLAEVEAGEG